MSLRRKVADFLFLYLLGMLMVIVLVWIAKVFLLTYRFLVERDVRIETVTSFFIASFITTLLIYAWIESNDVGDEDG